MEPRAQHEGDGTTVEAWKVVGFLRSHPISPRTLGSIIMGTEERRDEVTIRNEPRERKSLPSFLHSYHKLRGTDRSVAERGGRKLE